jgi:hypothetical protein
MEVWNELTPEIRLMLTAGAWVVGAWIVGAIVSSMVVFRLRRAGWGRSLDWRWLEAPTEPVARTAPAQPAPADPQVETAASSENTAHVHADQPAPAPAPPAAAESATGALDDDDDPEPHPALRTVKSLIHATIVALGARQAAVLWQYTPAPAWVDRLLPVAWTIAVAAIGALFAGNKILQILLPFVFTDDVRDRLDRFYPVPKGEQSFSSATRTFAGWGVYAICCLALSTLIADLGGWTSARGIISAVWESLITWTSIGLIWFVALQVLQSLDTQSKEHPDDSLGAGARAAGRRALVFGVAGLVTCFALFESVIRYVGPVLMVVVGIAAWFLRHYLEDYAAGIHLRWSEVKFIRFPTGVCRIAEVRPFVSRVIDGSGSEHLLPNAKLVAAFRADSGTVGGGRRREGGTERSVYVPPDIPVVPDFVRPLPLDGGPSSTTSAGAMDDDPHPFGSPAPLSFDPVREYALPGATSAAAPVPPVPVAPVPAPAAVATPLNSPQVAVPSP